MYYLCLIRVLMPWNTYFLSYLNCTRDTIYKPSIIRFSMKPGVIRFVYDSKTPYMFDDFDGIMFHQQSTVKYHSHL